MTEKELIAKIRKLRQIQPRNDWVLLTKKNIFGEEATYRGRASVSSVLEMFRFKMIFAPALATFVLIGLFGLAQYSLPGNPLYYVKRAAEKSRAIFVSAAEKPKYEMAMAGKRLEELNEIAQTNQVKNIAPALDEFQKTKLIAKNSVSKSIKGKSEKEAIKIAKGVASDLNEINKGEAKVFGSLGIDSGEKENVSADKVIIELLLKDAENSTLSEKQTDDLSKVKNYYEGGDYTEALEFYLTSSLNNAK